MTEETQGASPIEDAPVLADSSPAPTEPVENPPVENTTPDDARPLPPRDEDGKFISEKAQKRIDQLTWEKYELQRQLHSVQQPKEQPKPDPVPPNADEMYSDPAKYQASVLEYAKVLARQEAQSLLESDRKQQAEQKRMATFAERQREFMKSAPDYLAKVQDEMLPISEGMRDVIMDSPTGPEVAYYLANNRDLASQIAQLPPHLAALEMGRIEGRMQAQKDAAKSRAVPAVSNAPPPPPKVNESDPSSLGSVKATDPESDKLSIDDWWKRRNKEVSRKR